MTLSRSFAIFCFSFLLLNVLSAQQKDSISFSFQTEDGQMIVFDTLAADTSGGSLLVPNVFSPNGDGDNEYIEVATDGVTVYEFDIFTRNGTRVFHSRSRRIFWDGRSSGGQKLNSGIYYYVIKESEGSDPEQLAGFIYLFL